MYIIEEGRKEHIPDVLSMIKELAEFERAADEVEITEEELISDGFGVTPRYGFYIARIGEEIAGMALYYFKYSTWKGKCLFLEDMIVRNKHRGKGAGTLLFQKVASLAWQHQVKRLEWQVLNWNEKAISFYRKMPVNFDSEWINCKLLYSQLEQVVKGH